MHAATELVAVEVVPTALPVPAAILVAAGLLLALHSLTMMFYFNFYYNNLNVFTVLNSDQLTQFNDIMIKYLKSC